MNGDELFLITVHDHIMANTWRLIIERKTQLPTTQSRPVPDFGQLSEVLLEYRLIGLHLAASTKEPRRPS